MQMPLEEFTNNARERNRVVNRFLRSSSSVGSRTIGHHWNTQCEGRRGHFCENWGRQADWGATKDRMTGRGRRTKKRRWDCVKDTVQLLYRFSMVQSCQKHQACSFHLFLPVNFPRTSVTQSAFSHGEGTVPSAVFSSFKCSTLFWQVLVHLIFPLSLLKNDL